MAALPKEAPDRALRRRSRRPWPPWRPARSTPTASATCPARALIKRFPERKYEIKVSIPPRNWYSVGVRRGDTDLLQWLNTFVFFHRENGDLKKHLRDR